MTDIGTSLLQGQAAGSGLFKNLQDGQDWVGGLFRQAAQRQAGGLISRGDYGGASAALGGVGDLKNQEAVISDGRDAALRTATTGVLSSLDSGDPTAARTQAAASGNTDLYNTANTAGITARQQHMDFLGRAADGLLQISVPNDPAATNALRHQAFTSTIAPALQGVLSDADIAQIGQGDLSDQSLSAFKTALGKADAYKSVTTNDGNVIAFNERTGQGKVAYEGVPKPVAGEGGIWTLGDDGKYHFQASGPKSEYKTVTDARGNQHIVEVGGAVAPGEGPAAGVATAPGPVPTGKPYDDMAQAASDAGASPSEIDFLKREMKVESGGRTNAVNGSSKGAFQFHPDTFAANGGGDINSLQDQTKAALTLMRKNSAALTKAGVPITSGNLYLLHQQGPGGLALLTAPPDTNAAAALTPAYRKQYGDAAPVVAMKAITGNGGNPNMSAGDFVSMWGRKFGGGAPATGGVPAVGGAAAPGVREVYSTEGADGGGGGLTPDAIAQAARSYAITGTLPALARGKAGNADKEAIINQAATLGGPDILAGKARYQSYSAGLKTAVDRQTTVIPASQKALDTLDEAIAFAEKKQQSGTPVIEQGGLVGGLMAPVSAAGMRFTHNADYTHFKNLVEDAAAEGAVAISGARTGGSTDSARREVGGRINAEMTLDQLKAARSGFATVLDKAKKSAADIVAQRQNDIDTLINPAKAARPSVQAAPAAAPAAQPSRVIRYDANGRRIG